MLEPQMFTLCYYAAINLSRYYAAVMLLLLFAGNNKVHYLNEACPGCVHCSIMSTLPIHCTCHIDTRVKLSRITRVTLIHVSNCHVLVSILGKSLASSIILAIILRKS